MVPKLEIIDFIEVHKPITRLVTKFGGQPVWVTEPEWPINRQTGLPMRFICQIALDPSLFGPLPNTMAYCFISDPPENTFRQRWSDPHDGDTAVILQPEGINDAVAQPLHYGPSLYSGYFLDDPDNRPVEFAIEGLVGTDSVVFPGFTRAKALRNWHEALQWDYEEELWANKIGGTPIFLQIPPSLDVGHGKLLMQIISQEVPFGIDFGPKGVGYAFLSDDGRTAKLFYQGG